MPTESKSSYVDLVLVIRWNGYCLIQKHFSELSNNIHLSWSIVKVCVNFTGSFLFGSRLASTKPL